AGPQQLAGPLRVVPWVETRRVESAAREPREDAVTGYLLQAPERLEAAGELVPEVRGVGLYEVPVFHWQAQVQAAFASLALPQVEGRRYGQPYLAVGLADVRGVVGTPVLEVDGAPARLLAGTADLSGRLDGLHAPLAMGASGAASLPATRARLALDLAGTRSLAIVPLADTNQVRLQSGW